MLPYFTLLHIHQMSSHKIIECSGVVINCYRRVVFYRRANSMLVISCHHSSGKLEI